MCEYLPVPRFSSLASSVVAWKSKFLADRSPVPGTVPSLWSSAFPEERCQPEPEEKEG